MFFDFEETLRGQEALGASVSSQSALELSEMVVPAEELLNGLQCMIGEGRDTTQSTALHYL